MGDYQGARAGVQAVTAATATTKPQTEEEINKIN
jgi:hypothetical protein